MSKTLHESMEGLNLQGVPAPGTALAKPFAAAAKARGNAAFSAGDYRKAIREFSAAIHADPDDKVFYSNRSAAFACLEKYEDAVKDANMAIKLDATWSKAYSRLGFALFKQDKLEEAKAAFEQGLTHDRANDALTDGLNKVAAALEKRALLNEPVIGIDLGTTFSCVAIWENGKARVLTSTSGDRTTPSWVAFTDDGRRLVGDAAKRQAANNATNTLFNIKRIIGRKYSECLEEIKLMPFKVTEHPANGSPFITVGGKSYLPEQISAMVLEEMKRCAEAALGRSITKAVITVPAYFNDIQRRLTKDAGAIAGLDVLRIINEPTAAALAYGLDIKAKNSMVGDDEDDGTEPPATNVLVFDLGGGTFDVSLLRIDNGVFEVRATAGDTHLGGEDFDTAICNWVRNEISKQRDGKDIFKGNERLLRKLRSACETAKRELSSVKSTFVEVALDDDGEASVQLTRDKLNELCDETFARCMVSVKRVLADAKCAKNEVDEVVLVGGSTRIPRVQQILSDFFDGKTLCKSVNPDEAVAIGASVQGAILSGVRNVKTDSLLLVDVVPMSLGIECEGKQFAVVVPRNTAIPCKKSHEFTTVEDFQTSVDVRIFEGERVITDGNHLLGQFTITGIERAKKGEAKIDVCFDLNANGLLTVTASDKVTGARSNVEIQHDAGRLGPDEIKAMQAEAARYRREDERRAREAERELERESREPRLDDE
ncbi:unnamed protein product (mitochondrion) [Plasmodiophora brassicae]|uniref:Uncharacterized protein n=1 Tax=Plasmodiophora brassicae TaxID=37360 RepID=A0A0G4IT14_PLABS|nr:hypothetical protein PBRA_006351 [Plasmodiophora brassicae]SPQ95187.1 unnamed protein product [Plasmodiophora brassicae]